MRLAGDVQGLAMVIEMDDDMLDRCVLVRLPERAVFQNMVSGYDCETVWRAKLPENYKVGAVFYEPEMRSFVFRIHHESFQPVLTGMEIPELSNVICFTAIPYKTAGCNRRYMWTGSEWVLG